VERLIELYSNKGETVADPFGGIATVPYMAVKLGREGFGTELNADYFKDGLFYLRSAEEAKKVVTLFDLIEAAQSEQPKQKESKKKAEKVEA